MSITTDLKPADEIRAGERRELKSLVKIKIKALRAEIDSRHAEQMAQISARVARHFRDDDARIVEFDRQLDVIVAAAERKAQRLFAEFSDVVDSRSSVMSRPYYSRRQTRRSEFRSALLRAIESERAAALQRLSTLESELLETLTLDALKTDAAKQFVRDIPGIDSLMTGRRLVEIEARFMDGDDGQP